MTKRQPSFSEAKQAVEYAEWLAANRSTRPSVTHVNLGRWNPGCSQFHEREGLLENYTGAHPLFAVFPASDVSVRCHECGKILVDKYDSPGFGSPEWEDPKHYARGFRSNKYMRLIDICFGCLGKRAHARAAALKWARNHQEINRLKKEMKTCRQ